MAASPNANTETWEEKEDDVTYDANPITCIIPNNNNEKDEDTNFDGGDGKIDSLKHNDDTSINIAITNETSSAPTQGRRKRKSHRGLSAELKNNWEVTEKLRSDGKRTDKKYHHKKMRLTKRSLKAVEEYEKKIKESLTEKQKEDENIPICVEEFLAEAHYNLLHYFDQ